MPETQSNPEQKKIIINEIKECKAKVLFDQKTGILMDRMQVLEKENSEFINRLKKEEQLDLDKAQLLSTAFHDCRSPLTSIQLSVSLIERYYDQLDRQKLFDHLDKIKLAVTELTDKLNGLVDI